MRYRLANNQLLNLAEGVVGDTDEVGTGRNVVEVDDASILGNTADFDSILGDTSLRDELNKTDDGAWQFVLAKLDNPRADKKLVAALNKRFKEEGINALAMDWKKAASSFCGVFIVPRVDGFFHSSRQNRIVPPSRSTRVVMSTSFVYTLHRFGFLSRSTSSHTRKPRPPRITSALSVRQITGSFWYTIRLAPGSLNPRTSKPALQNAETA